jgi:hypothetical protein
MRTGLLSVPVRTCLVSCITGNLKIHFTDTALTRSWVRLVEAQPYNAGMLAEGNSTVLDSKLVAARWYLGELSGEEMPGIACQALELGHDGKNLRCLAGLTRPTRRDIVELVDGALRELGAQAPITKRDAALWMAKRVAGEIIEGRIAPYDGACRIGLFYAIEVAELQHWFTLVSNYEVAAAATGGIEESTRNILEAARSLRSDADFGAAVARFQKFLLQNKYPERIVWLMPEDVLLSGKRFVYVRVPVRATNELKARNIYLEGMEHGRGLLMSTICETQSSTYCYLWYPMRQEDVPQGIWPHDGSVKLSAKSETARMPGKPVKNSLMWTFLKYRHREHQNLKDFLFS